MNSLPKTVTRQHCGCDLSLGPSAPESSMLTTQLPSHAGACRCLKCHQTWLRFCAYFVFSYIFMLLVNICFCGVRFSF